MKSPEQTWSVDVGPQPTSDEQEPGNLPGNLNGMGEIAELNLRKARLYAPALVVAAVTIWMVLAGAHDLGGTNALISFVSEGWARMLGPVVLGFVAVVILFERVRPAVRRAFLARGHVQDLVYLGVYAVVVVPFILLLDLGCSLTLQHAAPWLRAPHFAEVPRLAILALAVLLMDAFNWMAHWSNHRWDALWRFHAVHHSQEELSVLTSFRAHPLVHTSFLISVIPVVLLSSNATLPATVITVYICLSSLPHANLRWTFGPPGKVIVSPAYHRLHHASRGRIDLNLGSVFTIWDVITRRAVFPIGAAVPITTGLHQRPVPIEQGQRTWAPLQVLGLQLADPFIVSPSGWIPPELQDQGDADPKRGAAHADANRARSTAVGRSSPVSGPLSTTSVADEPGDRPLGGPKHVD
jgi:sterol desaturase/sphingolipid hydroxylase (fatty acid hydroxylase superfamily)